MPGEALSDAALKLWRLCCCFPFMTLMRNFVTPSKCSGNQISVVIDVDSEVMLLLLRHYKGKRGDCVSGMALGVVRKLWAGNLMPLKPSYTHSIYPQYVLGMRSAVVWGISFLLKMTFDMNPDWPHTPSLQLHWVILHSLSKTKHSLLQLQLLCPF